MMSAPVQKRESGSGPAQAPFPQKQPLAEINGHQYYIISGVARRGETQVLYCAMELSAQDAEKIRELDRRLADPRYDMTDVRRERRQFMSTRSWAYRQFWAADGAYDFGFMPAADAQRLIRKI